MIKNINRKSWIIALNFLLFEILYWSYGRNFLYSFSYYIQYKTPIIAAIDMPGTFHSWLEMSISLLFLLASIWFMKQFIKKLIIILRHDGGVIHEG